MGRFFSHLYQHKSELLKSLQLYLFNGGLKMQHINTKLTSKTFLPINVRQVFSVVSTRPFIQINLYLKPFKHH